MLLIYPCLYLLLPARIICQAGDEATRWAYASSADNLAYGSVASGADVPAVPVFLTVQRRSEARDVEVVKCCSGQSKYNAHLLAFQIS